jgi:hypothetical protein
MATRNALAGECKQDGYSAEVKDDHKESRAPNDWLRRRSVVPKASHVDVLSW